MWFIDFVTTPSAVQAVTFLSLICALGLFMAKFRFHGISLGVTFVFFVGIVAGALGLHLDGRMTDYAESFGLALFVYTLGLQVGPGFFSSFRHGGAWLNALSLLLVCLGTALALTIAATQVLPFSELIGVLCGATTNTPALGAAQQTLKQIGQPSAVTALSGAFTYPVGMVGVIVVLAIMRGWFKRHEQDHNESETDKAYISAFALCNPALYGRNIYAVAHQYNHVKFVVSRIWREGKVILPNGETTLQTGDRLLVISHKQDVDALTLLFGKLEADTDWNRNNIDWNTIDAHLVSHRILITRSHINGKKLGDLHLRNRYGVTVSRVLRGDLQFVATPDLRLRMGDRVVAVGTSEGIAHVIKELGNEVKLLDEPNMITIFIGIALGLLLGSLPLDLGLSYPIRLGLAGGPIIVGILIGSFGPRLHMVAYTTQSANLMLRSLGLSIYLACIGVEAGHDFVAMVMQPSALLWLLAAALITALPLIVVAVVAIVVKKRSVATTAGMLCGAMANPIALDYVNEQYPGEKAAVAYATVYPLAMFLRVVLAQLMVMFWFA